MAVKHKFVRDEETMCKERRKRIKSGHGSLDGGVFLINYDVIPWGGGKNVNAIGINSSE